MFQGSNSLKMGKNILTFDMALRFYTAGKSHLIVFFLKIHTNLKERPFPFPHVSKLNLNEHFSKNVMQSAVPTASVISYVPLSRCIN